MSHDSASLRRVVRALALTLTLAAAAGSANAAPTPTPAPSLDPLGPTTTIEARCTWPLIGDQPMTMRVQTDIAPTAMRTELTPAHSYRVDADSAGDTLGGLSLFGAASIEGTSTVSMTITQPTGSRLNLNVPAQIARASVADSASPTGLAFSGAGSLPRVVYSPAGDVTWSQIGIVLSLTARDDTGVVIDGLGSTADTDHNPTTFDLPCTQTGGASTIASVHVNPAPNDVSPTATRAPTPAPTPTPKPSTTPAPIGSTAADVCTWPIIDAQPLTTTVSLDADAEIAPLTQSRAYSYSLATHAGGDTWQGLSLFSASAISGRLVSSQRVIQPNGSVLNLKVPLTVDATPVPDADPGASGIAFSATGVEPRLAFASAGTATLLEDGLTMSLRATMSDGSTIGDLGSSQDSDADPATFDVPCVRTSGPLTLATITVRVPPAPTPTPPPPTIPTPIPLPEPTAPAGPTPPPSAAFASAAGHPLEVPVPLPTPEPASADPLPPAPVSTDGHVLRFRNFRLPRLDLDASCPRHASVVLRGTTGAAKRRSLHRQVRVSRRGKRCSLTAAIKLGSTFAEQDAVVIRVTGLGLSAVSRRIRAS